MKNYKLLLVYAYFYKKHIFSLVFLYFLISYNYYTILKTFNKYCYKDTQKS